MSEPKHEAEIFCNRLAQMAPVEITRFAAWMAKEIAKPVVKVKEASA